MEDIKPLYLEDEKVEPLWIRSPVTEKKKYCQIEEARALHQEVLFETGC